MEPGSPLDAAITRMLSTSSRDRLRPTATPLAPSGQDDTAWLITLCDLTLLLLCFLVFSYIRGKHETKAPAPSRGIETNPQRQTTVKDLPNKLPVEPVNWDSMRGEMAAYIDQLGLAGEVHVESAGEEVLISLDDTVPFASGDATLRPRALPILEKVAAMALGQPALHLAIGGHTDDRPITNKKFPSNWELSTARASGVARYLIEKGVHPTRLYVQGFANFKPLAPNSNPQSRRVNRRVEIRLFRGGEKAPGAQ